MDGVSGVAALMLVAVADPGEVARLVLSVAADDGCEADEEDMASGLNRETEVVEWSDEADPDSDEKLGLELSAWLRGVAGNEDVDCFNGLEIVLLLEATLVVVVRLDEDAAVDEVEGNAPTVLLRNCCCDEMQLLF